MRLTTMATITAALMATAGTGHTQEGANRVEFAERPCSWFFETFKALLIEPAPSTVSEMISHMGDMGYVRGLQDAILIRRAVAGDTSSTAGLRVVSDFEDFCRNADHPLTVGQVAMRMLTE